MITGSAALRSVAYLYSLRINHVDYSAAALARVEQVRAEPEHPDALGVVFFKQLSAVQGKPTLAIARWLSEGNDETKKCIQGGIPFSMSSKF